MKMASISRVVRVAMEVVYNQNTQKTPRDIHNIGCLGTSWAFTFYWYLQRQGHVCCWTKMCCSTSGTEVQIVSLHCHDANTVDSNHMKHSHMVLTTITRNNSTGT